MFKTGEDEALLQEQYHVPIPLPHKNRPKGVSGLMRVKDEEEYVEASIDSVIDALDELIICYHDCTDRTPEIVKRKQREYPEKIKLYYYAPEIYAHGLTREEVEYLFGLPDDSIHLLSGYYNYTLSKATYRYAIKIDADQIYLTEELKQLCDAYRSEQPAKMYWYDRLLLKSVGKTVWYKNIFKFVCQFIFNALGWYKTRYRATILKQATCGGTIWFSGIELHRKEDSYLVGSATSDGLRGRMLYNGEMDHCSFEITGETYYCIFKNFAYNNRKKGTYSCIERFHFELNKYWSYGGLLWFHMRGCKEKNIDPDVPLDGMDYETFRKSTYSELKKTGRFIVLKACESYFVFLQKYLPIPPFHLLTRYLKKK